MTHASYDPPHPLPFLFSNVWVLLLTSFLLPQGEIVYFPYLKKYLRLEDYCAECTTDYTNGFKHIDVWTGGSATIDTQAQIDCEDALTPDANQTVIRNPSKDLAVNSGALWDLDGRCHTNRTYLNYTASTYCGNGTVNGDGSGSGSTISTLTCQTGCSWVGHCVGESEFRNFHSSLI